MKENGMLIKLSILVMTTPRRYKSFFKDILDELLYQVGERSNIEILGLFDNKKRSIGEKRNNLLQIANGEYLTFIDDDDKIAPDYIKSIMEILEYNKDVDCISFDIHADMGFDQIIIKHSKDYNYEHSGKIWKAKPSHIMVWKSFIAKKYLFKNVNWQEDIDWASRANKDIVKEIIIDRPLYYYKYSGKVSESGIDILN